VGGSTAAVALIPARSGSIRIIAKNVRMLAGHPLIAYTIAAAFDSGVFDAVVVSTDSDVIARIAAHYGAEVPFRRPASMAGGLSPDIEWVTHALTALGESGRRFEFFSILRPTSPLRQAASIRRAMDELLGDPAADSLRAIERCRQHPAKMWVLEGQGRIRPLLDDSGADPPWHSRSMQALPEVYAQNASLEIARMRAFTETGSIAGRVLRPFFCQGLEGLDLNDERDWRELEQLVRNAEVRLPLVPHPPIDEELISTVRRVVKPV